VQRVEFTIEPFVEGRPGSHVTEPISALRELGIDVEIGPFGTGCSVADDQAAEAVASIVSHAVANGATHVNIDVTIESNERGTA
jgi:uncharacterized protein YqgV (UPF0045/DUF77 family)